MSLQPGNSKLGPDVWSWSIPAGTTCPGQTEVCAARCYAKRGFYLMPGVAQSLVRNHQTSQATEFVSWMNHEIHLRQIKILRIHAAGDFDTLEYVAAWLDIVAAHPAVTFYGYTRSWRVPELYPSLRKLVQRPNVSLWYSCDKKTKAPPRHAKARRAYMSVDEDDYPRYAVDLVFRDKAKTIRKYSPQGALICPYENGVTKLTCSKCRLCWQNKTPRKEQICA